MLNVLFGDQVHKLDFNQEMPPKKLAFSKDSLLSALDQVNGINCGHLFGK
jgi:hypothetical protein